MKLQLYKINGNIIIKPPNNKINTDNNIILNIQGLIELRVIGKCLTL